jgi:hypothetical protein
MWRNLGERTEPWTRDPPFRYHSTWTDSHLDGLNDEPVEAEALQHRKHLKPQVVKGIGAILLVALLVPFLSACSTRPWGRGEADQGPHGPKIDRMDAVTSGGNGQAVLSLHKRYAYADACKFGLTLTNNLPYKITNIPIRFAAYTKGGVSYQEVTRNFFEIDPADSEYREIGFSGITCDGIGYVEISDPGRCAMGELTRFSSQPGDCIRQLYIAQTPFIRLVKSRRDPTGRG